MGKMIPQHARPKRCFILLEVMVSILIIGVAMVALTRGMILALDSLKRIRLNEQAIMMAESFLDDLILEPPAQGTYQGSFGDDPRFGEEFRSWMWELRVSAEDPRYRERPRGTMAQDLEQFYVARLRITHEESFESSRRWSRRRAEGRTYVDMWTILMEPDVFSIQAIQANQLF